MINQAKKNEVPADINLGISLSLGGIYCENSNEKPLTRSSSIVGTITLKKDVAAAAEELDSSSFPLQLAIVEDEDTGFTEGAAVVHVWFGDEEVTYNVVLSAEPAD